MNTQYRHILFFKAKVRGVFDLACCQGVGTGTVCCQRAKKSLTRSVVRSFLFEPQLLASRYYELSLKAFALLTFRSYIQPASIENNTLASLNQQHLATFEASLSYYS
jgi:hypothetical protein